MVKECFYWIIINGFVFEVIFGGKMIYDVFIGINIFLNIVFVFSG